MKENDLQEPVYIGEDVTITYLVTDRNGNVQDITGWAITFSVLNAPQGTVQFSKTVGSGIVLSAPTAGVATITLTAANLTLAADEYVWEAVRTDSGHSTVLGRGKFPVVARYNGP